MYAAYEPIEEPGARRRNPLKVALGTGAVVALVAFASLSSGGTGASDALVEEKTKASKATSGAPDESPLTMKLRDDYVDTYGKPGALYSWINDYDAIAEPHRWTNLVAECSICTNDTNATAGWSNYTYKWAFDNGDVVHGESIRRKFTILREYPVSLTAYMSGHEVGTYNGRILARYIRREIRQLTSGDRNLWLNTMKTLWDVKTAEGVELYGPSYMDITDLTTYHVTLSSDMTCDHMHDGLGFMTQHLGLTLMFEQAMQAVDPRVSLPYWDFTIDRWHLDTGNLTSLWQSPIFRADVLGNVNRDTLTIQEGRWKGIKIADNQWSGTHNSYGYMRAPWNNNPQPHLTRVPDMCGYTGTTIPSCVEHYFLLTSDTWYDFAWIMPYDPHGTVHEVIGGTFHCNETTHDIEAYIHNNIQCNYPQSQCDEEVETFMAFLRSNAFVTLKDMYRAGQLSLPDYCSVDTPFSECHATCDSYSDIDTYWETMFAWWEDVDDFDWLTDTLKMGVVDMMCDGGIGADGDQLESGSPMDPSFWSIHPTMERIFVFKKISNTFEDEDWPTHGAASVTNCTGHQKTSTVPFKFSLKNGDDKGNAFDETLLTNEEVYDLLDPSTSDMPYIYQDFAWKHCEWYGYNFADLLDNYVGTAGNAGQSHLAEKKGKKPAKGNKHPSQRGRRWLYGVDAEDA